MTRRMTVKPVKVDGGYTIIAVGKDMDKESPIEYRVVVGRKEAIEEIEAIYRHGWDLKPLARSGHYSINIA